MPPNLGKNKTSGGSFYLHAPAQNVTSRGTGTRLISPAVMTAVAVRYERGQNPYMIAVRMDLPKAAVDDIIATYEYRAHQFFKSTRGRK